MIELIQQRLQELRPANPVEEEQATKEIMQEIALYALWRADFFKVAAFQGGTSLRILYRLPRFSEDLDFVLMKPDPNFRWSDYLQQLQSCFEEYGLQSDVLQKDRMDQRIKRAVIKDRSVVNQLDLSFYRGHQSQKMHIKLEIDVEPPAGSAYEYSYLDFPTDHQICHQDLSSNFALKIHALLCREFLKGRDWYDFNWYIKRGVAPNLAHLKNALVQFGPWQGQQNLVVDASWLNGVLREKIDSIDWRAAARDVERFLKPAEVKGLELWSEHFFSSRLAQLAE